MRTWDDWIRLEKKKYKNLGMDPQELKEEVLSRFGIMPRSGERALMYLYSAFNRNEPAGVVTIVTDRAIHLSDCGVVSLGEAASSILYLSPVGKSQITLLTMDNDINLTGQKGQVSLSSIREFGHFLEDLQLFARMEGPEVRRAYVMTLKMRIAMSRSSFHEYGLLSDEGHYLVGLALLEPELKKDAIMLELEEQYRMGDNKAYHRLYENRKKDLPPEIREHLKYPDELFSERFIEDLSNEYSLFLTQHLVGTFHNLHSGERTEKQTIEYLYLLIRMEAWSLYFKTLSDNAQILSSRELQKILIFQARFQNEKMSQVYTDLIDGKKIAYPGNSWHDCLGLNALHYALIMRDKERVNALLNDGAFVEPIADADVPEDVLEVLDYVFLAVNLYSDDLLAREIFIQTSHTAKSLIRSIRSIDFYMDMSRKSSKVLFDELRKLRLSGDESSLTSVRAKIEDLAEHMEDYANSKQELEAGLEKLVQDHIDAARRRAAQVALKGSPLAQYILRIYLNPDLLYKNLFGTIYDYKLYRSGNLFFVTSVEEELPFSYLLCNQKGVVEEHILEEDRSFHWDEVQRDHYERKERAKRDRQEREEKRRQQEEKRRQQEEKRASYEEAESLSERKSIASRWFSNEAMEDASVLRQEYRALVKKYHPDENLEDTTDIMQQIQQERDNIRRRQWQLMKTD